MMHIRWTLTKRIWLSFALLVFLIGLIMTVVYPFLISNALSQDAFATIESVQRTSYQFPGTFNFGESKGDNTLRMQKEKVVGNIQIDRSSNVVYGNPIAPKILSQMLQNADRQKSEVGRYTLQYKGATLYYVVRLISDNTGNGFYISYLWDTYPNTLMHMLWLRMVFIFIMVGVLSLFIAFWLARYLKRPLDILGRRFEEIARMNWGKPFEWKGDEEFERLSAQFEKMRRNLIRYDRSQKVFLQQASHELKTPIMIVQSYAQSVKDGVYPKGDLNESMDVIIHESEQMERRVKKLLYFTRFDSLTSQKMNYLDISFGKLAEWIKRRFITQRPDISIHVSGDEVELWGDMEQIQIVLENLVENGLRYAEHNLWIEASHGEGWTTVTVRNDGRPMPEEQLAVMFEPFKKGEKGQFGLGLAIVKRIVQAHRGKVFIQNAAEGVSFVIRLPEKAPQPRLSLCVDVNNGRRREGEE
ncbi:MAG: HAMP domain-containing sensor histidine kinase [Sporolactobacillus sp.]